MIYPQAFFLLPTAQRSSDSHAAGVCCTRGRSAGGKRTHPPEGPPRPARPGRAKQHHRSQTGQESNRSWRRSWLCHAGGAAVDEGHSCARGRMPEGGTRLYSVRCGIRTADLCFPLGSWRIPTVRRVVRRENGRGGGGGRRSQQTQTLPSAAVE